MAVKVWFVLKYEKQYECTHYNLYSDIFCTNSDNTCIVNCNAAHACGIANGTGPEIHCPTDSSCSECIINCLDSESCSSSTIYGHECSNLNINIEHDDNQRLSIHSPNNGGSLTITIKSSTNIEAELKQSYIYAGSNTGNISIVCLKGHEFTSNEIYAGDIDGILSFITGDDCIADYSSFVCPNANQCIINCNGESCKYMTIDSSLGTRTLDFECGSITNCTGTVLNCDYNSNETTDCSFTGCNGPCVLPPTLPSTYEPTYVPTYYPSAVIFDPSYSPTKSPTNSSINVDNEQSNSVSFLDIIIKNETIRFSFIVGLSVGAFILASAILCFFRVRKYCYPTDTIITPDTNIDKKLDNKQRKEERNKPKKAREMVELQLSSIDFSKDNFDPNYNKNFPDIDQLKCETPRTHGEVVLPMGKLTLGDPIPSTSPGSQILASLGQLPGYSLPEPEVKIEEQIRASIMRIKTMSVIGENFAVDNVLCV